MQVQVLFRAPLKLNASRRRFLLGTWTFGASPVPGTRGAEQQKELALFCWRRRWCRSRRSRRRTIFLFARERRCPSFCKAKASHQRVKSRTIPPRLISCEGGCKTFWRMITLAWVGGTLCLRANGPPDVRGVHSWQF